MIGTDALNVTYKESNGNLLLGLPLVTSRLTAYHAYLLPRSISINEK